MLIDCISNLLSQNQVELTTFATTSFCDLQPFQNFFFIPLTIDFALKDAGTLQKMRLVPNSWIIINLLSKYDKDTILIIYHSFHYTK